MEITGFEPNFWTIIPAAGIAYVYALRRRGLREGLTPGVAIAAVVASWYTLYVWFSAGADVVLASSWLARVAGFVASLAIVVPGARLITARSIPAEAPASEMREAS